MASANFNQEIYSTTSNDVEYDLDRVVSKDFEGPYTYNFESDVPSGVVINGSKLIIPKNTSFTLNLLVGGFENKVSVEVLVTTDVLVRSSARLNTPISSSKLGNKRYDLDDVIDKDFEGPYTYEVGTLEMGIEIIGNQLIVSANTFINKLSILVSSMDGTTFATVGFPVYLEGVATFNTKIISSKSSEKLYNLDEVIDKDFEGPYKYMLNSETPGNVKIDGNTLSIPSNVEFELSLFVTNSLPSNSYLAIVSTNIVVSFNFDDVKDSFINNENLTQNLNATKQEWSKIINRNNNDKTEKPIDPIDTKKFNIF